MWYIYLMKIIGQRVLISPKSNASRRTRNRIREHGQNGFLVESTDEERHIIGMPFPTPNKGLWTFSSPRIKGARWFGHLPRNEFHLEAIGEEFFLVPQDW